MISRFLPICFDKPIKAEIILYGYEYNDARSFIRSENRNNCFGKYKGSEHISAYITKILYENATFLYDNVYGCLMMIRKE